MGIDKENEVSVLKSNYCSIDHNSQGKESAWVSTDRQVNK